MNAAKELFNATLGFDIIFYEKDGAKYPVCVEINGQESALAIPEDKIDSLLKEKVQMRMLHTPERIERSRYAESLDPTTQGEEIKRAWAHARSAPAFIHAFQNPDFLKEAIRSKESQEKFIPIEHRPRFYHKENDSISSTGFWVCKPKIGRKGKDIRIFTNKQFQIEFLETELKETYIAQEFISALGADNASNEMKSNPASMRFLMDFKYMENDSIDEVFTFAYQRVSAHSINESNAAISLEDIHVVNIARGAIAFSVSETEFKLGHDLALKIIRNIVKIEKSKLL